MRNYTDCKINCLFQSCDDDVSNETRDDSSRREADNDCERDFFSLPILLLTFSAFAFVIGLLLVCLTVKLHNNATRQIIKAARLRQNNQGQIRQPQVAVISGGGQSSSGFAVQPMGHSSEVNGNWISRCFLYIVHI